MAMMAEGRLDGKVAIVTGSSTGIGRAIALAYAHEGAHIVCADLDPESNEDEFMIPTHEAIRRDGGGSMFVRTDMSKAQDVDLLIQNTVALFGRVDVMVNNAGIMAEADQQPLGIHETPEDLWDKTMLVNTKSVFLGCKYAIAQMLKQEPHPSGDRGWIINMSSIFGVVGGRYNSSYSASKGAVSNLSRQVALDYASQKIRCNAICPGYIRTTSYESVNGNPHTGAPKHPMGGQGDPEDIVGAAIFLASSEARWITGVTLPVDGGYTAQ